MNHRECRPSAHIGLGSDTMVDIQQDGLDGQSVWLPPVTTGR